MATFGTVIKQFLSVNSIVLEDIEIEEHSSDGQPCLVLKVKPYKRKANLCPHCGQPCPFYDTHLVAPRRWRALDMGALRCYIEYRVRRVECPEHGVSTAAVPWAFHNSRFTKEFEFQTTWLSKELSKTGVAKFMRIDWKTVGRCVKRAFDRLEPDPSQRFQGLKHIAVDETSYRKGHSYITVVINQENNQAVWVHDGHGKLVFQKFLESLTVQQREQIQTVSGDGAKWIDQCCQEFLPNAKRCIDPFHVVAWAGVTLDDIRRRLTNALKKEVLGHKKELANLEAKAASENVDLNEEIDMLKDCIQQKSELSKTVKRSLYAFGKCPETLTSHQKEILDIVVNTQPELYRAYLLKEDLRLILKLTDVEAADAALKKWYYRASHSRLPEVKELATKIKRHKENILNTIKNKFSSARLESMNAKIKLMIRRAYGFRNVDNLIAYVLLFCSAIEIPLPNRPGPISINDLI